MRTENLKTGYDAVWCSRRLKAIMEENDLALANFQTNCDKLYEGNEIMYKVIERRRLIQDLIQNKMFDKTKAKLNDV